MGKLNEQKQLRSEAAKQPGFTLAEVLITLGIIGIVAALTMPTLIQNHRKQVIETRLKKFYSTVNQAVKLAEVDFGDKKLWYADLAGAQKDEDGNIIEGSSESEKWFKKYLAPYMQITKFETLPNGAFLAYLPDGSAFGPTEANTRDWFFYPSEPLKCRQNSDPNGSCRFIFCFYPPKIDIVWNAAHWKYHTDKGFEPNKYRWDGTEAQLLTGCEGTPTINHNHAFCTALIQYNNWKIPKDYPIKF